MKKTKLYLADYFFVAFFFEYDHYYEYTIVLKLLYNSLFV